MKWEQGRCLTELLEGASCQVLGMEEPKQSRAALVVEGR